MIRARLMAARQFVVTPDAARKLLGAGQTRQALRRGDVGVPAAGTADDPVIVDCRGDWNKVTAGQMTLAKIARDGPRGAVRPVSRLISGLAKRANEVADYFKNKPLRPPCLTRSMTAALAHTQPVSRSFARLWRMPSRRWINSPPRSTGHSWSGSRFLTGNCLKPFAARGRMMTAYGTRKTAIRPMNRTTGPGSNGKIKCLVPSRMPTLDRGRVKTVL